MSAAASATGVQQHDQPIVLGARVQDGHAPPPLLAGRFDQRLVPHFGDINRHENDVIGQRMQSGHDGFVSGMRL
ncbi:hypothetical protein [Roseixanthobacter glucoisosaccharinicivorans]|uniref:hypothetical protein n=1 Tax=Roseixanthobacter glucoisosaccharinicivorans TaxID=3119923 RepID=UPI00372CF798